MNAVIDEPLGDIERAHAVCLRHLPGAEHRLVLADARVWQLQGTGEGGAQVVGIQHREPAHVGQSVATEGAQVGVAAHRVVDVAVEGTHPADRARAPVVVAVGVAVAAYHRQRQIRGQFGGDRGGAGAGTTAAVRHAERLVQVEVQNVGAQVAGAGDADHGVHVGAVHVHQPTGIVHGRGDVGDALYEQAERVGVGDHQPGDVVVERILQRGEVEAAVCAGGHGTRPVAGHGGGGRVGAVRRIGHQHGGALAACRRVESADDQRAGKLAVGAR